MLLWRFVKGCRKVLILAVCLFAWRAGAQTPDVAARELARNVAAAIEREPAAFSFNNLSSLPPVRSGEVRAALESALRARGARISETAASEIRITLSENLRHWLLIAEVLRGEARTVLMSHWPRTPASDSAAPPAVEIERRLVWEQDEPILDFALSDDAAGERRLFVLEPERVAVYGRAAAGWEQRAEFPVARAAARDLRGRLAVQTHRFQAYLPGVACRGVMDPPALECSAGDALWPLVSGASLAGHAPFRAGRNAFEGPLITAAGAKTTLPPFYSLAVAGPDAAPLWVVSAVDGRTLVFDAGFVPAASPVSGWGSEIAGLEARCNEGRQVLATRPGDAHEPDAVQAWDVGPGGVVPVSAPLEFTGPVTALWPSGASSAAAVVRDPATGRYAAYHLEIRCGP